MSCKRYIFEGSAETAFRTQARTGGVWRAWEDAVKMRVLEGAAALLASFVITRHLLLISWTYPPHNNVLLPSFLIPLFPSSATNLLSWCSGLFSLFLSCYFVVLFAFFLQCFVIFSPSNRSSKCSSSLFFFSLLRSLSFQYSFHSFPLLFCRPFCTCPSIFCIFSPPFILLRKCLLITFALVFLFYLLKNYFTSIFFSLFLSSHV